MRMWDSNPEPDLRHENSGLYSLLSTTHHNSHQITQENPQIIKIIGSSKASDVNESRTIVTNIY